jgi:MOSC domain-containing protein YiiM
MKSQFGHLFQINISNGGVPKLPVQQGEIGTLGILGDKQNTPVVHGGPERAIVLFSLELLLALQKEGHPIFPGAIGENLTIAGLQWESLHPGVKLSAGDQVILEATKYASPCESLIPYFLNGDFSRVSEKKNPGWSRVCCRVLQPGMVKAGDIIREVS